MGNFGSAEETSPMEINNLSSKNQELLNSVTLMDKVTRFRWKLERVPGGIEVSYLKENLELLNALRSESQLDCIDRLFELIERTQELKLTYDETEKTLQNVFECQEVIYKRLLIEGLQEQLLPIAKQVTDQLVVLRTHLAEHTSKLGPQRIELMKQIKIRQQEVLSSISDDLKRFVIEEDLDQRELLLKSMGRMFDCLRELSDHIRNVYLVDTQQIIFNETREMHDSTRVAGLASHGSSFLFRHAQWLLQVLEFLQILSIVYVIMRNYTGSRIKDQLRADLRKLDQERWDLGNMLRIVDDARSWLVIYGRPDDR